MLPNISGSVAKHSGECCQTYRGMLPNIPGNLTKYSGECHQTFWGVSPNILGYVAKHSGVYRQIFWGMSSKIPGNVIKHSGEYPQTFWGMLSIFVVKEDNYWAGSHLESCQTSRTKLLQENSQLPYHVDCFCKRGPPQTSDWIPNAGPTGGAINWGWEVGGLQVQGSG